MSKQKVINTFSCSRRRRKNLFTFDNVPSRERRSKEAENEAETTIERKFTLIILIYIIYFEEFIEALIRFDALMPFLWMLKNVNIELFSFFIYLIYASSKKHHDEGGFSTHFVYIVNATGESTLNVCLLFRVFNLSRLSVALHLNMSRRNASYIRFFLLCSP